MSLVELEKNELNENIFLLSRSQRRFYVNQKFDDQSIAYNIFQSFKIRGKFEKGKVKEVFQKLVDRHEILRASFFEEKGEVFQKIHETASVDVSFLKVKEGDVQSLLKDFVKPFDLNNCPLLRVMMIETSDQSWYLAIDTHHIISDGISNNILLSEFMSLYKGQPLPPLKNSYKDYLKWQQTLTENDTVSKQRSFWLNEFSGDFEKLELPYDFTRPASKGYDADVVGFTVSPQVSAQLKKIAIENNSTLFSMLLSAYMLMLNKVSGQNDIVVGTVSTGRYNESFSHLVGTFVNTIPIRCEVDQQCSFPEFLDQVNKKVFDCLDNQMYHSEDLIRDLGIPRDGSRNPLFDLFFSFNNFQKSSFKFDDFEIEMADDPITKTIFDIELVASELTDGGISLEFLYDKNLFERSTFERFSTYFQQILTNVVTKGSTPLSELNVLTQSETKQLKHTFNDTSVDIPDQTILDLFESRVRTSPEKLALTFGDTSMTYEALWEQSDKIANYLREGLQVGKEDFVGVLLDRNAHLIPVVFGILKSGAVYVPISTKDPASRLELIVEESGMKFLISDKPSLSEIELDLTISILDIDEVTDELANNKVKSFERDISGSQLAYVIYTSGSTGVPKGVMIEHKALVNRLLWMQDAYPLNADDVLIQKTSLAFDVSVWELFWWSISGSALSLPPTGAEKSPGALIDEIESRGVTTIHFVPSMMQAFLSVLKADDYPKLKTLKRVFTSGEALMTNQVELFRETLHQNCGTRLINLYGPTEATIDVTYHECDFDQIPDSIPIGKPIHNTQMYVLDDAWNLCPIGVKGELFIAGAGLSRGYVNKEELTALSFIDNPFGEGKIYRTGDHAKWLSNGEIAFLGRKDDQIKLRGFRIELGEITAGLLKYPEVKAGIVHLVDDGREKFLVGYYEADEALDSDLIKAHMSSLLPAYMVPNIYHYLDAIPLSNNGKIDKKRLPVPTMEADESFLAPRNPIEEKVAEAVKDNLKLDKVGVKADYFSIGGDSIKAIQLIYKLNEAFEFDLRLEEIYSLNTVEKLAERIESTDIDSLNRENIEESEARLESFIEEYRENGLFKDEYEHVYPMSAIEKGMIYHTMTYEKEDSGFDGILYHEQNVYQIQFENFQFDLYLRAVNLLVQKHENLRKVFDHNHFAHIILKDVEPEVSFVDISHLTDEEQNSFYKKNIEEQRLKSSGKPFEILWRMNVMKINDDLQYMLFDMHHSLMDGWSLHCFLVELNSTYIALLGDPNHVPDPLLCSFKDHIVREMNDAENKASIDYWRKELKVYQRYTFPQTGLRHEFRVKDYILDDAILPKMKGLSKQLDISLADLFLTAYAYTMKVMGNTNEFVLGHSKNNRPLVPDGEKLLGCFVDHVPLKVNVPTSGSWLDYILAFHKKIKTQRTHERMTFHDILRAIDEPFDSMGNRIFDLTFNYIDFWILNELDAGHYKDQELRELWHDGNDVNQNTLFDFHVKSTLDKGKVTIEYTTEITTDEYIDTVYDCYVKVLGQFTENLNGEVNSDFIHTPEEKSAVLSYAEGAKEDYGHGNTVLDLFNGQHLQVPQNVAVKDGDQSLSYEQLENRSNRVAQLLRAEFNVAKGDVIGLLLDKELDLISYVIGVLKAGAVFIPLDLEIPTDRLALIAAESSMKLLLFNGAVSKSDEVGTIGVTSTNTNDLDLTQAVSDVDHEQVENTDLAYILYTSGSTGKPKGVKISHNSLFNYVNWASNLYLEGADKDMALFSSISFDFTLTSLFLPLSNGGTIHLFKGGDLGLTMEQIAAKKEIKTLKLTPSHLKIVNELNADISHFQTLILGGEQFERTVGEQIYEKTNPEIRIFNEYGPTEATIGCMSYLFDPKSEDVSKSVSIGKPAPNNDIYILDNERNLTPIGVIGEIYIGGNQLFDGYLNQESLTRERVFTNPFHPEEKIYKTGDLGMLHEDGNVEFLGRDDDQVKLRGYRIELSEIEFQLQKHNKVKEAIVNVFDDQFDKHLVGYYLSDQALDKSELSEWLSKVLPEYMIPEFYVQLDEIPLNRNGKIDRQALPNPKIKVEQEEELPMNDVERQLVSIWGELLNSDADQIGLRQSFFDLGGHSLSAYLLLRRIEKEFNVKVSMVVFFDNSTVEELSKYISLNKMSSIDASDENLIVI